jgi:hypothetical protein
VHDAFLIMQRRNRDVDEKRTETKTKFDANTDCRHDEFSCNCAQKQVMCRNDLVRVLTAPRNALQHWNRN